MSILKPSIFQRRLRALLEAFQEAKILYKKALEEDDELALKSLSLVMNQLRHAILEEDTTSSEKIKRIPLIGNLLYKL